MTTTGRTATLTTPALAGPTGLTTPASAVFAARGPTDLASSSAGTPGPLPRVTSDVATADGQGWSAEVTEVPTSVLSVSDSSDGAHADQDITVTVTARTDHSRTAASPESGDITC